MEFLVRKARPVDLDVARRIRTSLVSHYPESYSESYAELIDRSETEWRRWLGMYTALGSLWLAENKQEEPLSNGLDKVVGMVGLIRRTGMRVSHVGEVSGLGVLPEYCGRGLGKELMQKVICEARDVLHLSRLQLKVYEGNGAINLYHSLGFREEGRFEMYARRLDGSNHAALEMAMFFNN